MSSVHRSTSPILRSTACACLASWITENQLWSILHETNIAHGGEWIECRLLHRGTHQSLVSGKVATASFRQAIMVLLTPICRAVRLSGRPVAQLRLPGQKSNAGATPTLRPSSGADTNQH